MTGSNLATPALCLEILISGNRVCNRDSLEMTHMPLGNNLHAWYTFRVAQTL